MPTFDVITIGSALLDIYLKSNSFAKLPTNHFTDGNALALEYGAKTEVEDIEVCSGGAATNNAVSFARKGFKTAIIAEMGTDLIASTIKEELKREGVDPGMLIEEVSEETGISCILVHPKGGRSVAVFRGASRMLTLEDIPWHRLDTRWIYISSLGGDIDTLRELITYSHQNNIKIALNPGKKELESHTIWSSILPKIEVFILNREEAKLLSPSADLIIGPKIVCVTDGKNGGTISIDGQSHPYKSKIVPVIEETGAGDAFGSGLVAALIKGQDVDTAVHWGINQAASVVSFMGAKRGLLNLSAISKKS